MESRQFVLYILMVICLSKCDLPSLEERTCSPSLLCIHGICNGLSCTCDLGWTGIYCDTSQCDKNCTDETVCTLVNGNFYCVQHNNDSAVGIGDNSTNNHGQIFTTEVDMRTEESSTVPSRHHVCSPDYQMRPDRKCNVLPLDCVYGVCQVTVTTQMEIKCLCDPGSYGGFCEKKCCKSCNEPYGQCRLNGTNHEHCDCRSDYTGENCGQKINEGDCFNNSMCSFNGICVSGKCVCNNGWAGSLCDKQCPLMCFPPTKCVLRDGHFSCLEEQINQEFTPTEASFNVTSTDSMNNSSFDVCSGSYQIRPERICRQVDFQCVYGVCNVTKTPEYFEFKCTCDPGSYGGRCEKICCKKCNEPYGQCRLNDKNDEICECHHDFYGNHCQHRRLGEQSEDVSWTRWVIYVSVSVVLGLIAVVSITLYCMWKNRVLMVMQLVHKLQPFEDGDDKEYDAFISYRSTGADQEFVYDSLYPKLEREMGFKLCLHCRDFVPGETIANNIIWAINNSRRTILILSPEYVNSEWTKFEYQFAQREMLKRKHKIIPIMLTHFPIKDVIDQNLRLIVESVTYIQWPKSGNTESSKHFWKQIQLSMPKKKRSFPSTLSLTDAISSIRNKKVDTEFHDLKQDKSSFNHVKPESNTEKQHRDSESFHSYIGDMTDVTDDIANDGNSQTVLHVDDIEIFC